MKNQNSNDLQNLMEDNQNIITIYYFYSTNCCKVHIPKGTTVDKIIQIALDVYEKSEFHEQNPLRHKELEGYEIWLSEDEGQPDLDFKVDRNRNIEDLSKEIILVNLPGYVQQFSEEDPIMQRTRTL